MGGYAPHGQHNASDARFVACPGKAEGRKEAERPPALQAPPRPHSRRKRRTPPPPQPAPQHKNAVDPPRGEQPPQEQSRAPTTARPRPQRGPRQPTQWTGSRGRRSARPQTPHATVEGTPPGTPCRRPHNPKPSRGEPGPDRPPPKHARRSTGPGQDTRRGTDHVERPYQRPVPGPRGMRAPHHRAGGGSGHRESASAHTRKGHAGTTGRATGPSARNAQTTWNGVPASEGKGHPDGTARLTQRGTRGAGRGKKGRHNTRYRPEPPRTGCKRRAHTDGTLHPPRQ